MKDQLVLLMQEKKELLAKMCVYYSEQADMFESALDKACKLLAMNEEMSTIDCSYHSEEQWKQWFLKKDKY